MQERPLFFLHIPKTAGLSLHWAMVNAFSADKTARLNSERELWHLPISQVENLSYLSAHARYGFGAILRCRPSVLTFLRSPVERSVSAYWHMKNEDVENFDNPKFQAAIEECQSRTLEEIIFDEQSPALPQLANVQTWYLAGPSLEVRSNTVADRNAARVIDHFKRVTGRNELEVGTDELATAKTALDEIPLFGIIESMQDSLTILERELGLDRSVVPFINVKKVSGNAPEITSRIRCRLEALTSLDQELYAHALRLFEERKVEPSSREGTFAVFSPDANGQAPRERIERRVHDGFSGGGWYPREVSGGESWCWNGLTDKSWIDVYMEVASDLRVSLDIVHCVDWKIARQTNIRVAGVILPTGFRRKLRGGVLETVIPKSLIGEGPRIIRIEIPVNQTLRPTGTRSGAKDTRKLALALKSFKITQKTSH